MVCSDIIIIKNTLKDDESKRSLSTQKDIVRKNERNVCFLKLLGYRKGLPKRA